MDLVGAWCFFAVRSKTCWIFHLLVVIVAGVVKLWNSSKVVANFLLSCDRCYWFVMEVWIFMADFDTNSLHSNLGCFWQLMGIQYLVIVVFMLVHMTWSLVFSSCVSFVFVGRLVQVRICWKVGSLRPCLCFKFDLLRKSLLLGY